MTTIRNIKTASLRRIRQTRFLLAGLAALAVASSALAPAASADRQDGHGGGADIAHVASYLRQDLDNVVRSGKFRTGCILTDRNDPNRPVECTITATYKGELIETYSRTVEKRTAGWETYLHLSAHQAQELDHSDKRINYIKLKLEAEDAAGNTGTDVERVSVIRGLYG